MDRQQIRSAVHDFIDLIENGSSSASENERLLVPLLDRLALAQCYIEFEFDESDHEDAPSQNYDDLQRIVVERFPNYGYYNIAEHITSSIGESGCTIGDAIDDLADITRDLKAAEWLWANTNENHALWQLQFDFRHHWRAHLRGLQLYLDAFELDRDLGADS